MTKDHYYAFIIASFGLIFRLIIALTQKYPMNIDSYFYMLSAELNKPLDNTALSYMSAYLGFIPTTVILMLMTFFTFYLFYFLLRRYCLRETSILIGMFFTISPLVFFNNALGIFDKNVYTLFFLVLICYVISKDDDYSWGIAIILTGLFYFFWRGWVILMTLLIIYMIIRCLIEKEYIISTLFPLLLFFFLYITSASKSFSSLTSSIWSNKELIMETRYIWHTPIMPEYLLIVIMIIILILCYLHRIVFNKTYLFPVTFFFMSLILTCYMFRFNIFLMPFVYILLGILYQYSLDRQKTIIICMLIAICLSSTSIYARNPIMNDAIYSAMIYINSQDTNCIVGDWGNGHIYQYYSQKKTLFKGHSHDIDIQTDIMVFGEHSNCSILWTERDLLTLSYMLETQGLTYPIENYWILNQNNKYFSDGVNKVWVVIR